MTAPRPAAPLPDAAVSAVAELFEQAVAEHRTAGVTWAVIGGHDHEQPILAHGAAGHRRLEGGEAAEGSGAMDRATISRIASMTKSFTAATVLALAEEGALRLEDPISRHVPEAADAFERAADEPEPTLRDLLTMSAGLVTDNPWGDRQESMTREDFARTLRGGLGHVHRIGTGFEYSNTSYALLGRVIDEVTGSDYAAEIRRRFLEPLGLADTAFDPADVDAARLATGHRVGDREDASRFEPVPLDSPGVYGAMAGLFSTVDDVASWVRFLAAADAPDAAEREQEPLTTASRRLMQQFHRIQPVPALPRGEDEVSPGFGRIRAYGMGLVVERFADLGEVVSHSGGYPGYGSFMVWHRDSGVGLVALANSKYAPAVALCMQALRILRREAPQLLAARRPEPALRTAQAAQAALTWLSRLATEEPTQAEAIAEDWFADNMTLDVPVAERRRRLLGALEEAGVERLRLQETGVEDARVLSRAHLRWQLDGAHGPMVIDLLMDPRREARIQALDVTA